MHPIRCKNVAIAACCWCGLLLWFGGIAEVRAEVETLGQNAHKIFSERCKGCHGVDFKVPGLDILDRDILVASRGDDRDPYVRPGDPKNSLLWDYVKNDIMPPDSPLSDEEKEALRLWIADGAKPFLEASDARQFISEYQILEHIDRHLSKVRANDRRFQRYFTLTHLYNNSTVTDSQLRLYRAAFSKAVNSLSTQPRIVVPEAIDDAKTIFNLDLRDYGWEDLETWQQVINEYPYGLKPRREFSLSDQDADRDTRERYNEIERLYGEVLFDGMAYIRADWFTIAATRPPLYHTLASIPDTLTELQEKLGVDFERNFQRGTARRAGVVQSGVSGQNRLIEYHPSDFGAYWLSYDFTRNSARSNLMRFPLGPKFDGNDFDNFAFEHAGGEIVFNLPNRLQGYMLVDDEGNRIDQGPVEIVWDPNETSGSPLIVNGISCMSCHKHGTIALKDEVRQGVALASDEAIRKVGELYARPDEMNQLLAEAEKEYLESLEKAIGPFLRWGDDKDRKITSFAEPISAVARLYDKDVNLEAAARELGFENPEEMRSKISAQGIRQLGLGPLAAGGDIKRTFWESREASVSMFQEAAKELGLGTPVQSQ